MVCLGVLGLGLEVLNLVDGEDVPVLGQANSLGGRVLVLEYRTAVLHEVVCLNRVFNHPARAFLGLGVLLDVGLLVDVLLVLVDLPLFVLQQFEQLLDGLFLPVLLLNFVFNFVNVVIDLVIG